VVGYGTHDELYGGQIDLTKRRFQVFGASVQLEDTQFQRDPFKVARELSHHTYVYFYLNRLLRLKYETRDTLGITLTLSDNVVSKWDNDNVHRLYRDGYLMKEGHVLATGKFDFYLSFYLVPIILAP